jgi:hypothetical protein
MTQVAYLKKIRVSSDNVTFYDLPALSPSLDIGGDIIDDTDLATNQGYRSRTQGIADWSASIDSKLIKLTGTPSTDEASGATALQIVRNAKINRQQIYLQYLPTGVIDETGLTGQCVVETFNHSGDVSGMETVGISIQGNGLLSATA